MNLKFEFGSYMVLTGCVKLGQFNLSEILYCLDRLMKLFCCKTTKLGNYEHLFKIKSYISDVFTMKNLFNQK